MTQRASQHADVNRLAKLTPDRRPILTPLSQSAAAPEVDGVEGGSGAVLEAPAVVAGLDDLAMVREAVEQRRGHLGVAEHGGPPPEGKVGGDDHRGAFI